MITIVIIVVAVVDIVTVIMTIAVKWIVTTTITVTYQSSYGLPAGTEEAEGGNTVAQHLLLDFLADRHQQRDPALSTSARSFLTCRLFADELTALRSAGSTPSGDHQSQMLRRYHTLAEQLDKGLKCSINAGHIVNMLCL